MTDKRKRITDQIMKTIGYLDTKDHYNTKKYKEIFAAMTDEEFGRFCEWCNDPNDPDQLDHTITIQNLPFEETPLKNIYAGLEDLGVPAEEYVWFDVDGSGRRVRSRYRIPVGYVSIKRQEQLLSKKNRYSLDNDSRNLRTDQASGDSKVASISPPDAAALLTQGADNIMKELYGARSGDEKARNRMYKDIAMNGYVTLDDLKDVSSLDSKTTLNTLNTFLLSAGIRSDLITDGLKLPYTIKQEMKGGGR